MMLALAAAAFPSAGNAQVLLHKCRTIDQPGSYRLATNLAAEGNCLVVSAEGVSIDLNGFAIVGNGTGTAVLGVQKAAGIPQARTVVRNGDISNFAQATNLSGTVERLRVTSDAGGIRVGVGTVQDNIVQLNSSVGIQLADGIVSGNLLIKNGTGILVQEAGVITNNQAAGNKIGIDVTGTGSTLIGNIADGNRQIGIRVACPSNLSNNTAIGNASNLVLTGTGCRDRDNLFGP
jgi:parallel beta-helix repeat protein